MRILVLPANRWNSRVVNPTISMSGSSIDITVAMHRVSMRNARSYERVRGTKYSCRADQSATDKVTKAAGNEARGEVVAPRRVARLGLGRSEEHQPIEARSRQIVRERSVSHHAPDTVRLCDSSDVSQ